MKKIKCVNCNKVIDNKKPYWQTKDSERFCSQKCIKEGGKGRVMHERNYKDFPEELSDLTKINSFGEFMNVLDNTIEFAELGFCKEKHEDLSNEVEIILGDLEEIVNLLEKLQSVLYL